MKSVIVWLVVLLVSVQLDVAGQKMIRISTDVVDLIFVVSPQGRLYQAYLGDKLQHEPDLQNLPCFIHAGSAGSVSTRGWEVYPGSGAEDYFEPALAIAHNDGNLTTILKYVSSDSRTVPGGTETVIRLKDEQYPVEVTLHYIAYAGENVFKVWSEIRHQEKKPVTLTRYASAMLYFSGNSYFLTEFSSDWAKEAGMSSQ